MAMKAKIGTILPDDAGFFKAIADERMFEFGGEGLRKWTRSAGT